MPRQHGEAERPTSNQPPRSDQGRRLLEPAALRTCPLASLLSQVRACLGPGGYCRRPGNGGAQTCLPAARGVAPSTAWYGPASVATTQDPREADDTKTSLGAVSLGWLPRSGDINAGCTSRGSRDMSHDDQGQTGTSERRVPVASLVLKGQAQARSPEASGKGFHIGATRPRPAGQQDGGHRRSHSYITTRAFDRRRPPFVRIVGNMP